MTKYVWFILNLNGPNFDEDPKRNDPTAYVSRQESNIIMQKGHFLKMQLEYCPKSKIKNMTTAGFLDILANNTYDCQDHL